MSSDSELTSPIPDDATIKSALQSAIHNAYAQGKESELSVNSVRAIAEKELGLDSGFFKTHDKWKSLSKTIINETVEEAGNASPAKTAKAAPKARQSPDVTPSKKRKVVAKQKPRKRKKESSDEDDSAEDLLEESEDDAKATAAKGTAPADSDSSRLSEPPVDVKANGQEDSKSELSDVKDEPPPKKWGKRASDSNKKAAKPTKSKPAKTSKDADLSPDEQEIKRLQGWLIKCGIRKMWHKELAPYDSNKAKIKHLKGMLEDAGMTGRYSQEKATAIKEQRELAADLEAVQEGNKTWGMGSGSEDEKEESDSASKPTRKRSVVSRFVDFGDDEDDE
ncbi:hypothetical protein K461DRAFT_313178 [Myriangium duriaei CBS 260.36]|uniref:Transcriptional regulator n=1 Tax=Myriangium duriaei CBS 260.36 TaxID=1168546 RepID=A0A9P4J152_9PEZI|nr:hypothetical protein K461DRAFT_313178 [Myriangium duriaei CBS 260.36]